MTGPTRRATDPAADRTYEAMRRELGFEGMTREQLFMDLFGEAFGLSPRTSADEPVRVEQVVEDPPPPHRKKKR